MPRLFLAITAALFSACVLVGQTPLITSQSLNGSLRHDYDNYVGMVFTVNSSPIKITQLGRFCSPSNSQSHLLKLVDSSGNDVPSGSVTVSMAGCSTGSYVYGSTSACVSLQPNSTYFFVSKEAYVDDWHNYDAVTATSAVTSVKPAYVGDGYQTVDDAGKAYVPLNLMYQTGSCSPTTTTLSSGTLAAMPAGNCTNSGLYLATDQTYGSLLYYCASGAPFSQLLTVGGSGAVTINGNNTIDITSQVPRLAATNAFSGSNSFSGPLTLSQQSNRPACDSSLRGTFWFTNGGSGSDHLSSCAYNGTGFAWQTIF